MATMSVPSHTVIEANGSSSNNALSGQVSRSLGLDGPSSAKAPVRHELLEFRKGELIYGMGDPAAGIYLVQVGRVKIYRLWEDGREITLGIFGRGDIFGEESIVSLKAFNTFAESVESCRVVYLRRDDVLAQMLSQPQLATELMRVENERLIAAQGQVESLAFRRVTSRVAELLVKLADGQASVPNGELVLRPGLTHQQMASLIGTTRETFTSTLSKLAHQNILQSSRKGLRILDLDALRRHC